MPRQNYTRPDSPYMQAISDQLAASGEHRAYGNITTPKSDQPFARFGIVLPILMLCLFPALLLLYIGTALPNRIIYLAACGLTLLLIAASTVIIVISGLLGAITLYKYRRLSRPNSHPRPRR